MIGLILNNFYISPERPWIWNIIEGTIQHYKSQGDFYVAGSCAGVRPHDRPEDLGFDVLRMQSAANSIQAMHNNPSLIKDTVNECIDKKCEKLLFVTPFYRINNFKVLENSSLAFLKGKFEYAIDIIEDKNLSFDFLFADASIIKKVWNSRPWNYNIKKPSENLYENFINVVGKRKLMTNARFLSKHDLEIDEIKVYWETNIKTIKHRHRQTG